jgi:hypothetical protein
MKRHLKYSINTLPGYKTHRSTQDSVEYCTTKKITGLFCMNVEELQEEWMNEALFYLQGMNILQI